MNSLVLSRAAGLSAGLCLLAGSVAQAAYLPAPNDARTPTPSHVAVAKQPNGDWRYLVDGQPQVFIGMGYDPIYRYLSTEERAANYQRDFQLLHDAGVNTITGWDADKGYEQDKFDELTLSIADQHGLGVIMPMNLPPEGDYTDPAFVDSLVDQARDKVQRFKSYHALRMWGVGNEVFWVMDPSMWPAFEDAYLRIADVFHQLDTDHPVIYREAEDAYVPEMVDMLQGSGDMRPWLLYGMNVYNKDPKELLGEWNSFGLDRPLLVSEFGTQGDTPDQRAQGYAAMWHSIRCFPSYVLGGAPYVWTTQGPEPTDKVWGLMDGDSQPVDGTFGLLSQAWRSETLAGADCQAPAQPVYVPPSQPLPVARPVAPPAANQAAVVLRQTDPALAPTPSPGSKHRPPGASPDPTPKPDPTAVATATPHHRADPTPDPTARPRSTPAPASPKPAATAPRTHAASPTPSASAKPRRATSHR